MIFVQNFTQPDFKANNFTPVKCVICDFSLKTSERELINISNLGIFGLDINLFNSFVRKKTQINVIT